MAILSTDEEKISLNKFGYMNIDNRESLLADFKDHSLRYIAKKLLERRDEALREGKTIPSFGQWGGITDKEQYEMLEKIVKGDYKNISGLRLKDFYHNPSTEFYAYAFYENQKPENTISIPRGTMGTQTHNNSLLQLADGFTNMYWRDNAYMGLLGVSVHFSEAREFVERNRGTGQTLCTGFSAGAAYCAYVAATSEGISGTGYNGPGIGYCLTEEQRNHLKQSEFMSKTCASDAVGALFFHPERHEYTQCQPVVDRDRNGDPIYENGVLKHKEGLSAGHYIQAIATDPKTGMTEEVAQTEQAKKIEKVSQQVYLENRARGNPLGLLLDGLTVGKGIVAPAIRTMGAVELSQIESGGNKEANEELAKDSAGELKDTIANRAKISMESTVLDINQTLDALKPGRTAVEAADKLEAGVYPQIGEKALEMGQAKQDADELYISANKDISDSLVKGVKKAGKAVMEGGHSVGVGAESEAKAWQSIGDAIHGKAGEGFDWMKKKIFGPSGDETSRQPVDNKEHAQIEQGKDKVADINQSVALDNKGAMEASFREFSSKAPQASLEQRKQAAMTSVSIDSIFNNTYGNPETRELMKRGVKNILVEALQSGDRILPIQKYDPQAEPTRVVRAFTPEEIQQDRSREHGMGPQMQMSV
jgi:hypothetical protein